ncbi:hypothetical protein [Streptomyces sp. CC224B]|uniref:hypothetical protein n=1 Tax=Streptomyces sp. CC224B TaxID=3044571 RepID=UPI0024A8666C|nr:hypothetical protein [Streptomyces sp. CC224B]
MSDALTEPTGLESQYAAQLSADLERNATEQDRIGAEVIALQERLQGLRRDRELLLRLQRLLGEQSTQAEQSQEDVRSTEAEQSTEAGPRAAEEAVSQATEEAGAKAEAAPAKRVPAPRGSRPATRATKTRGSSAGTKTKRPGRKKPAPPKSSGKEKAKTKDGAKAASPTGPTLIELVRAHLGEQKEPRSAAEVTAALTQNHPERAVKTTVVRTTLENLVAKGQAQRSKQKNSVFYSAPEAGEQQPAPPQDTAAASQPEPEAKPEG